MITLFRRHSRSVVTFTYHVHYKEEFNYVCTIYILKYLHSSVECANSCLILITDVGAHFEGKVKEIQKNVHYSLWKNRNSHREVPMSHGVV